MSEKQARQLFDQVQRFRSTLSESGWLTTGDRAMLSNKSPVDLFASEERPLVVGLFGGTGVGKSSLLNRLAGADIARTGVVRPTSMEITAYLHRDIQLDALPEHFSSERFSENRHTVDRFTNVMWVDMPDFDSAETENREQVLQWLPHIDLLIYVVTPERYKDAEGWRMMLDNGYRHAWMFVMNQWDRADPVQHRDFVGLLTKAGFNTPQVFRTVCVSEHEEDEFTSILDLIESLAHRNVVAQLQKHGWMQRVTHAKSALQAETESLHNTGAIGIDASFAQRFQKFETTAALHLDAPFKTHSNLFAREETNPVMAALKSNKSSSTESDVAGNIAARSNTDELWDDWLSVRLRDTFSQWQLAEDEHGIPKAVLLSVDKSDAATEIMSRHFDKAVANAIESPGPLWQRIVVKAASWLKFLGPLVALLWISYRVVNGFVTGVEDRSAYVGMDFLVNGLLLAGLAWFIPWIVEKTLTPSLPDAVYRSLHSALKDGLEEIKLCSTTEIDFIKLQRRESQTAHKTLEHDIDSFITAIKKPEHALLDKLLISTPDAS